MGNLIAILTMLAGAALCVALWRELTPARKMALVVIAGLVALIVASQARADEAQADAQTARERALAKIRASQTASPVYVEPRTGSFQVVPGVEQPATTAPSAGFINSAVRQMRLDQAQFERQSVAEKAAREAELRRIQDAQRRQEIADKYLPPCPWGGHRDPANIWVCVVK